jgi:hypothetical protein
MKVRVVIEIERTKTFSVELDRLMRFLKGLDAHPDGIFTVEIKEFLL